MKEYYYSVSNEQLGPFSIEQLKEKKLTKDTMVWYEGMENWQKAGDLEELKELFKSTPPPLNTTTKSVPPPIQQISSTNKEKTVKSDKNKNPMLKWIFIGIGAIVVLIIVIKLVSSSGGGSYNEPSYYDEPSQFENNETETRGEKTPAELKNELKRKERRNPSSYLTTKYKLKYKVLAGKDQIDGKVYNSATMAKFKDLQLKVTFYSNTDAVLGSENYIVYKYVNPGGSTSYQLKVKSPKATRKIGVDVTGATPVD